MIKKVEASQDLSSSGKQVDLTRMFLIFSLLSIGNANAENTLGSDKKDIKENKLAQSDALDYRMFVDSIINHIYLGADEATFFNFINNKYIALENGQHVKVSAKDYVINSVKEFDNKISESQDLFRLDSCSIEMNHLKISNKCDYSAEISGQVYDKNIIKRFVDATNSNSPYNLIHELGHAVDYTNPDIKNLTVKQLFEFKIYSELARRTHVCMVRKNVLKVTGNLKKAFPFSETYQDKFLTAKESKYIEIPYFWENNDKNSSIIKQKLNHPSSDPFLGWLVTNDDSEVSEYDAIVSTVTSDFLKNYQYYLAVMLANLENDFVQIGCSGQGVSETDFNKIIENLFSFYVGGNNVSFPVAENHDLKTFVNSIMLQKKLQETFVKMDAPKMNMGRNER